MIRRLVETIRTATLFIALCAGPVTACNSQVTFTEYSVPSPSSGPYGITVGPDGNLWFTESGQNQIARIGTDGTITEFPIPTPGSYPAQITAGSDGNLWFTEYRAGKIGKITPGGAVTEFTIPSSNSYPYGITAGPDGNLWFTETGVADGSVGPIGGNNIGRITTAGIITEFPIPTPGSVPRQITSGPDGNLWFCEENGNNIGKITAVGVITEYPVPTPASNPTPITVGPDGNLWFGEYHGDKIGRITTDGTITEFPLPAAANYVNGITSGPDGNLWFVEYGRDVIGSITMGGEITEYPIPTSGGGPVEIVMGPDGNLWFTELGGNKIGKIALSTAPSYTINPLYDQSKAHRRGSTAPIKLQVLNGIGGNVSSSSLVVHAVSISVVSGAAPGALEDSGSANPDNDFRYDPSLEGYIFNLSLKGYSTGTYNLNFTVGSDPTVHTVQFQVK